MVTASLPNSASRNRLPAKSGAIQGLEMDAAEARRRTESVKNHLDAAGEHLNAARKDLWAVHDGNGWRNLGYKSWRAYATAEFGKCASMCYKELRAAQVELELETEQDLGSHAERVLRPLTKKGYTVEARKAIWDISQLIVGDGGQITSGVTEVVSEAVETWLATAATEGEDGAMHPLIERMSADVTAKVRQKRIAQKEHITRMGAKRDYILGGVEAKITRGQLENNRVAALICLDEFQRAKLIEALQSGKPIYASLWTE